MNEHSDPGRKDLLETEEHGPHTRNHTIMSALSTADLLTCAPTIAEQSGRTAMKFKPFPPVSVSSRTSKSPAKPFKRRTRILPSAHEFEYTTSGIQLYINNLPPLSKNH